MPTIMLLQSDFTRDGLIYKETKQFNGRIE